MLRGVTPEMLVWWFNNIDGEMDIEGERHPHYRVWHPRYHFRLRYEAFGRRPENAIDIVASVERLDRGGFAHVESIAGVPVARMDYAFSVVEGGTRYENSPTVGLDVPVIGLQFSNRVRDA